MIALTIKDTKNFMSHLLVKDTFDKLLLSEATIATANTFNISGTVNKNFFSQEELANLPDDRYTLWQSIKPICFSLIKGNKVPTGMKIVFMLSSSETEKFLQSSSVEGLLPAESINGLFININYSDGTATIVTGTALKVFTMDKTTEHCFDMYVKKFLNDTEINFEEI